MIEIEGRCGRGLHEGHRGVASRMEGSIVIVGEGLDVVEPVWHTHVDWELHQPICS